MDKLGVVLVNLGTPEQPSPASVRRFLRQFLSDTRVVELPRWLWWLILNLFILPWRPRRVAKLYQSIWMEQGSPMRVILQRQQQALSLWLAQNETLHSWQVLTAMTYGEPTLAAALDHLVASGSSRLVVFPLYPQYSATTTAPIMDQLGQWLRRQRNQPSIRFVRDYHDYPAYIQALAQHVRDFWQEQGRPDKLLMSFHGIPQDNHRRGDPYPDECRVTAQALADALQLPEGAWLMSFQSRFGAQIWMQPYTDVTLKNWAEQGVESVQVICPAFSADCLETLEEIAEQNREIFLDHGGKYYSYIPALNDSPVHIQALAERLLQESAGW
ncbi:MAG: ferrochelatase [Pseudomonadales bacterium]|nr:ferrochelatase [Pseudomonadales bacterium]